MPSHGRSLAKGNATPDGTPVVDSATSQRIARLAIPPAYTDVWICPFHNGHLQATGRDARGREQYRYHPRWREIRDAAKYERLLEFAAALPNVRKIVARDLAKPGMPNPHSRRERRVRSRKRLIRIDDVAEPPRPHTGR
jgi:DNA topoisomerase IB